MIKNILGLLISALIGLNGYASEVYAPNLQDGYINSSTDGIDLLDPIGQFTMQSDDFDTLELSDMLYLGDSLAIAKGDTASLSKREARLAAKKRRNFRFSVLGGPGYSSDYGFVIGASALFTFSTDKSDSTLQRSVLPVAFGLMFTKPFGYAVTIDPLIIFKGDKTRLTGTFVFKNTVDNYYGVGYESAHGATRSGATTAFSTQKVQINPIQLFRVGEGSLYMGPTVDYTYQKVIDPGSYMVDDPTYIADGGTADGFEQSIFGAGYVLSLDTRDVAKSAYRGYLFEARALYYSKFTETDRSFGRLTLDYRQYKKLSDTKRMVLAWRGYSEHAFGNVPFYKYAELGGSNNLRGYYQGQYRDNSTILLTVEYRQMWEMGTETKLRRFLSRLGYAAWAGSGFLGSNPVKYDAVLPNAGLGFRFEVQPQFNFRFDMGYSFADRQTLFYFNMTEAF